MSTSQRLSWFRITAALLGTLCLFISHPNQAESPDDYPTTPILRPEIGMHTTPIRRIDVDREERFLVSGSLAMLYLTNPLGDAMLDEQDCAIRALGCEGGCVDYKSASVSPADPADACSEVGHGQVRSLYAMLRFYSERFVRTYRRLGRMQDLLQAIGTDDIGDEDHQMLTMLTHSLLVDLIPLNLSVSIEMAETFRRHCEEQYATRTLLGELNQLFNIIEAELKTIMFIQIPKHRQGYYEFVGSQLEESVLRHLPSVVGDLEEGAKCFALGRHTACIFHLMRVMEMSVQVLGKKLKIRLVREAHEKNWHNIIDEVNKAIKNMYPKTIRRKLLQSEYAAIASHLFNVKMAWRNSVMHPKASYTEEEAVEVLRSVITFVNYLSRTLR